MDEQVIRSLTTTEFFPFSHFIYLQHYSYFITKVKQNKKKMLTQNRLIYPKLLLFS